MTSLNPKNAFADLLKTELKGSTRVERKQWAIHIIKEDLSIQFLSKHLFAQANINTQFLWLLSEIGFVNKLYLKKELPYLFQLCQSTEQIQTENSFPQFWLICGIPDMQEAEAINCLFAWLQSPDTNLTCKARSMHVLLNMTKKYPELVDEFKSCLLRLDNRYTVNFNRKIKEVLSGL